MMICCIQTLLLLGAQLALSIPNNFFYHNFRNGNGNKEIHFSGFGMSELTSPREPRVKWSWQPAAGGHETDVLVAIGSRSRSFGEFRGRVQIRQDFPGDATLVMTNLMLNDTGRYHCEVVDGLEDKSTSVYLELRGVVFPYQHPLGHYHLSFLAAQQACEQQASTLATFSQLFQSWKEGLNWCNAGWLADGTVQYPMTRPRVPCGGDGLAPGVRSYGRRHLQLHRYDVFCFSSTLQGKVYYLQPSHTMNLTEAQQACQEDGAQVAKVGQLYAAWKLSVLDRCDAGWLADGSHKHGVYCYKSGDN
ncbi:Hyaluronan and proteoglycan link protein 3 [Dissostichus eleginoides]|uniref:Hyaluronan and proteoglycan link protein 3 n=1 Tax=Dissostichus eleginoides TaxID=100907 RepID=A0AAD9BXX3_DISEL|nr:Hyaluronan and proteoglycan link protein 3 [Dissostichus eleginoides]